MLHHLELAEELHLSKAHGQLVLSIARQLASPQGAGTVPGTASLLETAQLATMSPSNTRLVLAALASAVKQLPSQRTNIMNTSLHLISSLPAANTIAAWSCLQGEAGAFTWDLQQFTTMATGTAVLSPSFTVGGLDWQIKCYPSGNGDANAGYVSLYVGSPEEGNKVAGKL